GPANIPYLLAWYLFRYVDGRKSSAKLSGEVGDDWAWVAPRPERQKVVAAGAFEAAKDAPAVNEIAQVDLAPIQAPQPPPPPSAAGRIMP
nr:hypothetical protein [Tanacetum cinerariifolium]